MTRVRHAVAGLALALLAVPAAVAQAPQRPVGPDPGVGWVNGTFFVASTSSRQAGGVMPVVSSTDRVSWPRAGYVIRRGKIPKSMSLKRAAWAPEFAWLPAIQRYAVFFSARHKSAAKGRCIWRGISQTLVDFTKIKPILCGSAKPAKLIDPTTFTDGSQLYLLLKNDYRNHIVLRTLRPDGTHPGRPRTILKPGTTGPLGGAQAWERGNVEAPTLFKNGSRYYLFYSGGSFARDTYGVGVARTDSLDKPFRKFPGNPILSSAADPAFCGAGHQAVTFTPNEGWLIWYHAFEPDPRKTADGVCQTGAERKAKTVQRRLHSDPMTWDNTSRGSSGWPRAGDGTPAS